MHTLIILIFICLRPSGRHVDNIINVPALLRRCGGSAIFWESLGGVSVMRMRSVARRLMAVVMGALLCQGCAIYASEFHNRGGFSDHLMDHYWFKADTKELRVLRSYSLIGALLRVSVKNLTKTEREILAKHVDEAARRTEEAFACAYSYETICPFFDERLAAVDRSLLQIAVIVISNDENEVLFDDVKDKLFETTALGQLTKAASGAIDVVTTTATAAVKLGDVASSLLKIGKTALETGQRFGAVYRDSIELDLLVTISSMRKLCEFYTDGGYGESKLEACSYRDHGRSVYALGSGNIKEWVAYLNNVSAQPHLNRLIIPSSRHFIAVSDLIYRACGEIMDDSAEQKTKCQSKKLIYYDQAVTLSQGRENSNSLISEAYRHADWITGENRGRLAQFYPDQTP